MPQPGNRFSKMIHACALGLLFCVTASAQSRPFVSYDAPGAQSTFPVKINAGGQITGYYKTDNQPHAFIRNPKGQFVEFVSAGGITSKAVKDAIRIGILSHDHAAIVDRKRPALDRARVHDFREVSAGRPQKSMFGAKRDLGVAYDLPLAVNRNCIGIGCTGCVDQCDLPVRIADKTVIRVAEGKPDNLA